MKLAFLISKNSGCSVIIEQLFFFTFCERNSEADIVFNYNKAILQIKIQ